MHVYKVGPTDGEGIGGFVLEKEISTSRYTVNDIVTFTAFGFVMWTSLRLFLVAKLVRK
jgi:hypothetical protein